jgi:hypothetical protein
MMLSVILTAHAIEQPFLAQVVQYVARLGLARVHRFKIFVSVFLTQDLVKVPNTVRITHFT